MENKAIQHVKDNLPTLTALFALNALPGTDVATLALQEIEYLSMHAVTKPDIYQCMPETVLMAVKSAIKKNLSLDPDAGLVYVKTRNVRVNNEWRKALEIQETANGIISINRQCGRILDIDRAEVKKDEKGRVISVSIRYLKPSVDLTGRTVPKEVEVTFDEDDFYRWRRASHKENSRAWKSDSGKPAPNAETMNYANENYTSWKGGIDPEFARAKAVRHALKKLGTNQNETRVQRINISPSAVYVDPVADQVAATDGEYTPAEEVPESATQVYVQTHEIINIPNSSDL